jgi:hypothetical protein
MLDRRKMVSNWMICDDRAWLDAQKERMEKADPSRPCEILESRGKIALFFTNGYYRKAKKGGINKWVVTA